MSHRVFLLLLLIVASAGRSSAQEPKENFVVVTNWGPSQNQCNAENTNPVSLANVLSDPENYAGECIHTEGYYRARALFLNKRDTRRKYPTSNERSADRRLGIYGSEVQFDYLSQYDGVLVEVSGMVSDCAALQNENTIMVLGYCHYSGGPIIGLLPD